MLTQAQKELFLSLNPSITKPFIVLVDEVQSPIQKINCTKKLMKMMRNGLKSFWQNVEKYRFSDFEGTLLILK